MNLRGLFYQRRINLDRNLVADKYTPRFECGIPRDAEIRAANLGAGRGTDAAIAPWVGVLGGCSMATETELIFKSRRVVPGRLLNAGFHFDFLEWPSAVKDLVERWRLQRRPSLA